MTLMDKQMLWRQFGAGIDSLKEALQACPNELWAKPLWGDPQDQWIAAGFSSFWYLGFHALFWLDLYLSGTIKGFAPPAPFDLSEMETGGVQPRPYSREELLDYLDYCRGKARTIFGALSPEEAERLCQFPWGEMPYAELQLYNLRHVQEHAAQLHLFLGQQAGKDSRWVFQAE